MAGKRITMFALAVLAIAAVGWWYQSVGPDAPGLTDSTPPPTSGDAPWAEELASSRDEARGDDTARLSFEAPVVDDESGPAGRVASDASAGSEPMESGFEPEAYALTKREIFRAFWQDALAWTSADFHRQTERVEALTGREVYQVYVYLRTCLDQPRSQEQLDRFLVRAERSRRSRERIERFVESRVEGLIRCEGIEESDLPLLAFRWLSLAAERNYPQAQLAYHKSARWLLQRSEDALFRDPDLVLEYRERAVGHLYAAIQSGHPDALLEFSEALDEGILFPEDPVRAYAYAVAADLAAHGAHDAARRAVDTLAEALEPAELDDGREQGRELCERYCRVGG